MLRRMLKNNWLRQRVFVLVVRVHNKCYNVLAQLAIMDNNGAHPKHRILGYHQFFVDSVAPGDRIIDVGCAHGEVAYDVAGKARAVVGIDFNEKSIAEARAKRVRPNLEYIVGDATVYPFKEKFDKIILSNVLEHIDKRIEFLQKMHTLGGTILIRVPLINRDWLPMYKKEKGLEYRLDLTHYIEYTPEVLNQELAASSWQLEKYSIQFGELWGVVQAKRN